MKNKVALIILAILILGIIVVFIVNKQAQVRREQQIASQFMSAEDEADIIQAYLNYKTQIGMRQEEQKFRWQDLFMGQAAVSEGVGNIFLGMGGMGG